MTMGSPNETWAELLAATPKNTPAYKDYLVLSKEQGAGGTAQLTPYAAQSIGESNIKQLTQLAQIVDSNYNTPHPSNWWDAANDLLSAGTGPLTKKSINTSHAAVQGVKDGVVKTLDTLNPWNWIKGLFSSQLWDRILFVLGGVALVIIGIVLMLHKSVPTPL